MRTYLPLILLLFSASSILWGQSPATLVDTTRTGQLNEIVISAQRSPTERFQTPEAISVVTNSGLIRSQSRTSPEALQFSPGVFVQKTNHGGGSPFVRGLTGNQTLLLIDGIRLSNATFRYGPNQYFNTLDVFDLSRIEVLRGSGSVQYGSDALGGAIQAFSRPLRLNAGQPQWNGKILLRGTTRDMEQSTHADLAWSGRRFALGGGMSLRRFGDLVGGDTSGRQAPSGYREYNYDLKAKWMLAPGAVLTLVHQNTQQLHVPVYHKVQLENFAINEFDPQRRALSYARFEQDINRGIWEKWAFTTSWQQTEEGRRSRKNNSAIRREENDRVGSLGMNTQFDHRFNARWTANSGAEAYWEQVQSTRVDIDENTGQQTAKRGLYPDGARLENYALYSLHTFDWRPWMLTAGARWNAYIIRVSEAALGEEETLLRPSALVGNLAVMRHIAPRINLFASVNTGFRAPNIDDLGTLGIVDFRFEVPNYNLRPEKSTQIQVGGKWRSEGMEAELLVYRNELRDLITRIKQDTLTQQGYPLYQKENVEKAFIQGLETNWTYHIGKNWTAQGSLTYTYGQNRTQNEPVRRIPPIFGRLAIDFEPTKHWSIGAEWLGADKQDRLAKGDTEDNRIPQGGTPGWQVLNLHASYAWRGFSAQLSGNNLFNEDYRTHGSGINGMGRSATLTLMYEIGK